jgi:hypothetical protein
MQVLETIESLFVHGYIECYETTLDKIRLEISQVKFDAVILEYTGDLSSNDSEVENTFAVAKSLNSNASKIIYFIKSNLKQIIKVNFDEIGNLEITFENLYVLKFLLTIEHKNMLSLQFIKNKDSAEISNYKITNNFIEEIDKL